MSVQHHIPRCWNLPTPFRDARGDQVVFPVRRPSCNSIIFFVALANLAHCSLPRLANPSAEAYLISFSVAFALAVIAGEVVERFSKDERSPKAYSASAGLAGLVLNTEALPSAARAGLMIVAGLIVVATIAVECGCRASARYDKPADGSASSTPTG